MNILPSFILVGIFSATFFSSMSNLIGASRVLNRLAQDKLFGKILHPATVEVGSGNPIISVIISWICVVVIIRIFFYNFFYKYNFSLSLWLVQ